ncbi:hypothetical protein F2N07_07410 [Campylobacter jejuni]|nr:hypothetical protein [Campylobacter jejuni]MBT0859633.1 hypothetical protein [Campylobacter coli]
MEEIRKIQEEISNIRSDILKKYKYINEKYNLICEDNGEEISLYTQIEDIRNDIDYKLKDLDNQINNFNDFYNETFGEFKEENNKRSGGLKKELQDLKENIEELKNEANDKLETIQEKYNLICEDNGEKISLYTQIKNTKDDTEKQLQELSSKINNFNNFYNETFGEFDKESNARSGGLKKELQDLKEQFQDYIEAQKEAFELYEKEKKSKFAEIEKDIKKLLGGATNGSLAHSYEISKKSYFWPIIIWNALTMGSIFCIAYISYDSLKDIKLNDYMSILSLTALRLPIYIPLVWLGIFSTRRRNEIKRLQEEYKHKETIAKTYYGYQEQMAKLSDSEKAKELQERLMSNLVDMVNQNPNTTLNKIKQENTPMIDFIEKFSKLPKDGQDMIKDMINKINIGAK